VNDSVSLDPALLTGGRRAEQIVTSVAHPARMYDYYLGGKDNYEVDRSAAEEILADFPQLRQAAKANRAFLRRAVRHLAGAGIRQFLDIGTGIPGNRDTAETARAIAPKARIVAVDNDPIVAAHARARLTNGDPAATAVLEADLREPDAIIKHPELRAVLNLDLPVALLLVSVLHFLPDHDRPHEIVKRLMGALAPGSYLVLSHGTADAEYEKASAAAERYRQTQAPITLRRQEEIAAFFDGMDLLEPGVVKQPWWRPHEGEVAEDWNLNWDYGGVACKP
jgi:trans-aconitate methyltransferase